MGTWNLVDGVAAGRGKAQQFPRLDATESGLATGLVNKMVFVGAEEVGVLELAVSSISSRAPKVREGSQQ